MGRSRSATVLERGRESYARSAWTEAYELLTRADQLEPLSLEDLELLAISAYMLGRDDETLELLQRAFHEHSEAGQSLRAARDAFWIGMNLAIKGEMGPAGGWLGRAHRLVDREEDECVEQGYLLLPIVFQREAAGDFEGAAATAAAAAEIAERFADRDLFALALQAQGGMLLSAGRVADGLALLDESMVTVAEGSLSPIVTGTVYCGVILFCEQVYDLRRAKEWTAALAAWWEGQPELMAFTGRCLVHRAQILQLQGAWRDALAETERANRRFEQSMNQRAAARACYLQGEVRRLRGEAAAAEDAYREASRLGSEPQPGLALLRLQQGQSSVAAAAIRRAVRETIDKWERAGLLPAYVEIVLAVGEPDEARAACAELEEICAECESEMLAAMHAQALGAVELATGDPGAALASLRQAFQTWQELEAPYEGARTRVVIARACRALGDEEAFALELEAARSTFEELGAAPDIFALEGLEGEAVESHGLTGREVEVLRLVASGKSNKAIAAELVISEHTVARHVQNIFRKLDVTSRTAASAFAFEHDLV